MTPTPESIEKALAILRAPRLHELSVDLHVALPTPAPGTPGIGRTFEALRNVWHEETAVHSSLDVILTHPAYRAIIGLGREVVPYILHDLLRRGPGHWHHALARITYAQPVPREDFGNLSAIRLHWLEWGIRNGFVRALE